MTFHWTTVAQNLAALRARYQAASGVEACRIARWLDANLTDAQLRNIFNLTLAQAQALRTRLQAKAAAWTTVEAEVGE